MDRRVRVRFAPSPTGPLHIGGVRTALYNYLFAHKHGGDFILRIEDTDQNRFVPGAEDYIIESLKWCGICPNEGLGFGQGPHAPYRQSERKPMYLQYAHQLLESGHAYYAFDTEEELDAMKEQLKSSSIAAKYDAITRSTMKNSLTLSEDEVKRKLEAGDHYVIRIKLPRKEDVRFHDEIRGWVTVNTSQMDDKVLLKSDGMPTYHLANVVDDYLMKITHVIRGEEWLPSAPLHVLLYRYLGWEDVMPKFAHLPLLLKPEGNGKLSKRDGDRLGFPVFPLQWTDPSTGEVSSGYRESGYNPNAVINMLAFLGWNPGTTQEIFGLEELTQAFTLERISKSGAKFDVEKAKWFNHQYLKNSSNAELANEVLSFAEKSGYQPIRNYSMDYIESVCGLMKEKVNFSKEILDAGKYFFEEPATYDADVVKKKWKDFSPGVLINLAEVLQFESNFNAPQIEKAFIEVLEKHGLKNQDMLQTFRLALSGVAGGPPIFEMAQLLGREIVVIRLTQAAKKIKPAPSA